MGQSALHLAMQKLNNNVDGSDLNVKILKLLINNGANTSLNDNHGKSPLLYGLVSSMYNSIDDLNYLLFEMIDKLDSQKCEEKKKKKKVRRSIVQIFTIWQMQ